jgi:hypothetical protein
MIIKTDKQVPERRSYDFYPTPIAFAKAAIQIKEIESRNFKEKTTILDPGAGDGIWGKAWRQVYKYGCITGVEIRKEETPMAYNDWINADYLTLDLNQRYGLILGNPPFKYAQEFIEKSWDYLEINGMIAFVLPLKFLESQKRYHTIFATMPPNKIYVCVRRLSFSGDGKTNDEAHALFVWQKSWYDKKDKWIKPELDWINWETNENKPQVKSRFLELSDSGT